jgi:hypothetical protein
MSMPEHAATSPLEIVNVALEILGEEPLALLDAAQGSTASVAVRLYNRRIDTLLASWPWNFAIRTVDLSQIHVTDPPPEPWRSQFNLPPNALRIISTDRSGELYVIAQNADTADTNGTPRLYAMRDDVKLRVVMRPLDELFPPHFANAAIMDLAHWLSKPITGQFDPNLREEARMALTQARLADSAQQPPRLSPRPADPRAVPRQTTARGWYPFLNMG